MNEIQFSETTRSYASEANLRKALEKFGFHNDRFIVVRTPDGRWTAIFTVAGNFVNCGYIALYASQGFMTI